MSRRRGIARDVLAIGALALATALLYRELIATNQVLAGVDALTFFTPYRDFANAALREGRLPLWNPYLFAGVPFLADIQSAVLYPLNWLFIEMSAAKALAWSVALHVWLAAAFTYGFARRVLMLKRGAAWLAAAVFAFGGFVGGQAEHVNQLSAGAWLPLLLWLYSAGLEDYQSWARHRADSRVWRKAWACWLGLAVVVALQLLSGHSQSTYVSLVGLSLYALWPLLEDLFRALRSKRLSVAGGALVQEGAVRLATLVLPVLLGLTLSAVQLLPTLELSRLSVRSAGLAYRDAAAVSLKPRLLLHTLLPVYGEDLGQVFGTEGFTEYVAYAGVLGLGLALVGAWRARSRRTARGTMLLTVVGFALALGAYNPLYFVLFKALPGFDLFRAPARWMLLYAFGVAVLAGLGADTLLRSQRDLRLPRLQTLEGRRAVWVASLALLAVVLLVWMRKPGWTTWLGWSGAVLFLASAVWSAGRSVRFRFLLGLALPVALFVELFAASRALPYASPTASEAVTSVRTAPAHLLADPDLFRFLSMSDTSFDPGDLAQTRMLLDEWLAPDELYELVVANKKQEVLAPNLPLYHRLYAVDGYGGGILPLQRYALLQRLLLDREDVLPDGRLREQLSRVPSGRFLDLLNVKYVITDKLLDVWFNDVYYDLQHRVVLAAGSAEDLVLEGVYSLSATHVGIVSHLKGAGTVRDGDVVAEVTLIDDSGDAERVSLVAGQHTSEGLHTPDSLHARATVVHETAERPPVDEYIGVLQLGRPLEAIRVHVEPRLSSGQLVLRAITLIDERTGAHVALTVSPEARYLRVHSGDVKIYENQRALPRAFVVGRARTFPDDEAALQAMRAPEFDPAREVILSSDGQDAAAADVGQIVSTTEVDVYEPERTSLRVSLSAPGFLVLSDAWYPGWKAWVDGAEVDIQRANVYFRAVALPVGEHVVELRYEPASLEQGLIVTYVALGSVLLLGLLRVPVWAHVFGRRGGVGV